MESHRRGDSNKYPQHMFLGILNTVVLNISNYLPQLIISSIQIVVLTSFVVLSNVGIKRLDCKTSCNCVAEMVIAQVMKK